MEELGGEEYSSYSFLTLALDVVSGKRHAPAAFYPRYPLDKRLVGPQEPLWTQRLQEKSFAGDRTLIAWSSSL
jgi:hypothetical protein